jgi:hypothetical protein
MSTESTSVLDARRLTGKNIPLFFPEEVDRPLLVEEKLFIELLTGCMRTLILIRDTASWRRYDEVSAHHTPGRIARSADGGSNPFCVI